MACWSGRHYKSGRCYPKASKAPAGHWWRAELDRVARRHIGQSLDSLGKARFYQRTLRDQGDASEDVALVVNATRDNAVLLYLYQQ